MSIRLNSIVIAATTPDAQPTDPPRLMDDIDDCDRTELPSIVQDTMLAYMAKKGLRRLVASVAFRDDANQRGRLNATMDREGYSYEFIAVPQRKGGMQ